LTNRIAEGQPTPIAMRSQATMGTACAAAHRTVVVDTIGIIKPDEGKAWALSASYLAWARTAASAIKLSAGSVVMFSVGTKH